MSLYTIDHSHLMWLELHFCLVFPSASVWTRLWTASVRSRHRLLSENFFGLFQAYDIFQAIFSLNQDSVVGCGRCSQNTHPVQSADRQSFIFSLSGSCLNPSSGSASESSGGGGRDGGTQKQEGGLTSSILFDLFLLISLWEVHRKHCEWMSLHLHLCISQTLLSKATYRYSGYTFFIVLFVFSCVCVVLFSANFLINDASLFRRKPTIHWIHFIVWMNCTCMKGSFETTSTMMFCATSSGNCSCRCWGKIHIFLIKNKQYIFWKLIYATKEYKNDVLVNRVVT